MDRVGEKEDLNKTVKGKRLLKWASRRVKKILFYRSFDLATAKKCFPIVLLHGNNTDKEFVLINVSVTAALYKPYFLWKDRMKK